MKQLVCANDDPEKPHLAVLSRPPGKPGRYKVYDEVRRPVDRCELDQPFTHNNRCYVRAKNDSTGNCHYQPQGNRVGPDVRNQGQ